jgi:hypothetical protein
MGMDDDDTSASRHEVVLVTRPAAANPGPPHPLDTLREVVSNSVGMATYTASTLFTLVEQTVTYTVTSAVNSALDRLVPTIADAIIERIDLTDVVIDQVDLARVVNSVLDELDLTELVLQRVDVNAIVAAADIDAVIDRVPIIPLADYVIDEIDLPQIIRDSTNGIAGDAMNTVRRQAVGADDLLSRIADRMILRRRQRKVAAPGDPESLSGRFKDDLPHGDSPTAQATTAEGTESGEDRP